MAEPLPPVEAQILIEADAEEAFSLFVDGLGRWWPIAFTVSGPAFASAGVEDPLTGHEWYEFDRAGVRTIWGRVHSYKRPTRLVLSWAMGADRLPVPDDQASRVTIEIHTADVDHCEVRIVHAEFERHGEDGARLREAMAGWDGWPMLLAELAREARFT